MLRRLVPLSIATPIAYYAFAVWYRGPDTSPAHHGTNAAAGYFIAVAIISVPAVTAFLIARARGHTRWAAVGIAGGELILAALFAVAFLILLPFTVLLVGGDHS
jgi:hypothetical protein